MSQVSHEVQPAHGAPCSSFAGATPDTRHIIAVDVHNKSVSIKTDNICTSPCLTGCETTADAAAFGAEPMPASLEYNPLRIPCKWYQCGSHFYNSMSASQQAPSRYHCQNTANDPWFHLCTAKRQTCKG